LRAACQAGQERGGAQPSRSGRYFGPAGSTPSKVRWATPSNLV
jgi:hypothetical protein